MTRTLADLAEKMRDIDFAMLSTHTEGGAIGARPMSTTATSITTAIPAISRGTSNPPGRQVLLVRTE